MALVAFAAGAVVGARHVSSDERVARDFMLAWQRGDTAAMYSKLSDEAQRRIGPAAFARAYHDAVATATMVNLVTGRPHGSGGEVVVPVRVRTRIFGTIGPA